MIVENGLAWAFPTNMPITPGHVLVVPKRCVAKYEDLTAEEKLAIEDLRAKLVAALKKVFGAEGFNFAWNEAKLAGQSVPHFHLHIVPRTEGDAGVYAYEPRKFLYRPGSREETPESELGEVANQIRSAIERM
jgi:diadenosine tetraphosphate (Ap4A) HIT family hydrolase